jgi:hypothetical protein
VTEQLELLAVAALRLQLAALKLPEEAGLALKLALPLGELCSPASVSVTVAVQVEPWLRATEPGLQETLVEVVRLLTVRSKVPKLVWWVALPP